MDIDDFSSHGYVRQWSLQDGQARCVLDALPANDAGAMIALQANAAVRSMVSDVEALEANTNVEAPEPIKALARWRAGDETVKDEVMAEFTRLARLPLAHDPRPFPALSFLEFIALFTDAEQGIIFASNDSHVRGFCLMAAGASQVNLDNQQVISAVRYLALINLISADRVAQILSNQTPTS